MIVLLTGPIAVGKTELAVALGEQTGGEIVRVREVLAALLGTTSDDRKTMQIGGADLDRRTQGRWLQEYLSERSESVELLIVDAVRTVRQVLPVVDREPGAQLLYLSAQESTLRTRFERAARGDAMKRSLSFDAAMQHTTERDVSQLRPLASWSIETDEIDSQTVCREAMAFLPPMP